MRFPCNKSFKLTFYFTERKFELIQCFPEVCKLQVSLKSQIVKEIAHNLFKHLEQSRISQAQFLLHQPQQQKYQPQAKTIQQRTGPRKRQAPVITQPPPPFLEARVGTITK